MNFSGLLRDADELEFTSFVLEASEEKISVILSHHTHNPAKWTSKYSPENSFYHFPYKDCNMMEFENDWGC